MKKKILSIILAAVMATGFTTSVFAAESEKDYKGSMEGVSLKVGTDTSFVPFCFPDDNNEYTGFDIDLLAKLSEYLRRL